MKYKVKLTYFKPGGKYYSCGSYISEQTAIHNIFFDVREMRNNKTLPDLVKGHSRFYVLINVPDHPHDHPRLITR